MDKNLKAELVALREEVIRNLKNVELVVDNIDTKLKNDEEVAALMKCPTLESLLSQCKNIKWDPSVPTYQIDNFSNTVKDIESLMETPVAERYINLCASIIGHARALDKRMGKMPEKSSMEEYWEEEAAKRKLVEPNRFIDEDGKVKDAPKNEEPSLEVKLALDRMNIAIKKQEDPLFAEMLENNPDGVEIGFAPEWAKNVGQKNMKQILKEASEWDETSQAIFVQMWNKTKKRRMKILREALDELCVAISSLTHRELSSITSLEDAQRVTEIYEGFEKNKSMIINIIKNHDPAVLELILSSDRDDNFIIYYKWLSALKDAVTVVHASRSEYHKKILTDRCMSMLDSIITDHEKRIPEAIVINPSTFLYEEMPHDKKASFEKVAYSNYIKDLEQAYKWVFSKKEDKNKEDEILVTEQTVDKQYHPTSIIEDTFIKTSSN